MITESLIRLEYLCKIAPALLSQLDETAFSFKRGPDKWSKKEILGHLIDSAANNHHRWVRAQFENEPLIFYDQNKWNAFNFYQDIPAKQVIEFWKIYNLQIAALLQRIPQQNLQRSCDTGSGLLTLEELFDDYISHLEHHLKQIINY